MDDSKEKRIKELIAEITTGNDYCISEAVKECRTVNDVINYIIDYHGPRTHFSELESSDIDDAFKWLEQNLNMVDYHMSGCDFIRCTSVLELINEAYCLITREDLLGMENKIQELIDLVHESDDEEDNSDQERGGNL